METPFEIERVIDAPVQKVWEAISTPAKMKEWYFNVPDFKPIVGSTFTFSGGPDGKEYIHLCIVREVLENKKLSHSWRYEGYEGDTVVTWQLFDEGNKTRVKLTHEGLETFPASNPDFARKNFEAGWTEIVGKLLPDYLINH